MTTIPAHTQANANAFDSEPTDLGPAVPAPSWCEPGTEPAWELPEPGRGGGAVCVWSRTVGDNDDVHIMAVDHVTGGRVLRTTPRVWYSIPLRDGLTAAQARQLGRDLVAAADLLEAAANVGGGC